MADRCSFYGSTAGPLPQSTRAGRSAAQLYVPGSPGHRDALSVEQDDLGPGGMGRQDDHGVAGAVRTVGPGNCGDAVTRASWGGDTQGVDGRVDRSKQPQLPASSAACSPRRVMASVNRLANRANPTRAGSAADEKGKSVTCYYVVVELGDLNP
jgi:hypothetical protein